MSRRRQINRRTFLRGLGGAAIALPLMPSLGIRNAYAAEAAGALTADGFPKRFIYFFHPNGTMPADFWPTPGATPRDFQLNTILQPLQAYREKLWIAKGVNLTSGGSEFGPGEPHQRGMGALLTGRPLQQGNFVGGDGSLAGWADGISLDQHIANYVGDPTAFKSLQLGVRADTTAPTGEVRTRLSYEAAAKPLPPQNDPLNVFNDLFSDMVVTPGAMEDARAKQKSILDGAIGQFESLNNRLGYQDKQVLDAHLATIRDLERRLQNDGVTGEACYIPDTPADQESDSEDTMPQIAELQIDMLVMAMACDLTRVGGIQFSNAKNHIRFPWLDSLGDGHQLSHAGPSNSQARTEWVARDTWFAQKFGYLLMKLDSIPEGNGTMLDNTAVIWLNELSQGNTHSHVNMPFVLAGSAGGQLDVGKYVELQEQSHTDILIAIQNAFGIQDQVFGDPRFANGALSELVR